MHMPLLFHLVCERKGTQRMRERCVVSVLARPKMCNQTPRHSSTKLIKQQGTAKVKAEHWGITEHGVSSQDLKKRRERAAKAKF